MKPAKYAIVFGLLFLLGAGCAPAYRTEFQKLAKDKGWTKDQQAAALEWSYRLLFGKPNDNGTYSMVWSRLPKGEAVKYIDARLDELSSVLGYQNEGDTQWVDGFGLRKDLERSETALEAARARIKAAELYDAFEKLLGLRSYYSPTRDESGYDHQEGYDASILVAPEVAVRCPFESTVIREAKARGILQEIERFTTVRFRKYDRREQDPAYPDDPNRFIWYEKNYSLEIVKYKIVNTDEKPSDNYGNYIEAYRITDGKRESAPAIRAYLDGRGGFAVAVIDTGIEGRDIGFGLPDYVTKLPENTLVSNEMITTLFPEDPKQKRVKPVQPSMNIEIAPAGKQVELWEKAPTSEGWTVPLTYKRNAVQDNYNVRIKMRMQKSDGNETHANLRIGYFIKEWTDGSRWNASVGSVWEYYKPRGPYDKPVSRADVLYNDETKKVRILFPDGTEDIKVLMPKSNVLVDERPEMIAYTLGEKRWLIKDEDGDGIYELRKEISPVLDVPTGDYSRQLMEPANKSTEPVS